MNFKTFDQAYFSSDTFRLCSSSRINRTSSSSSKSVFTLTGFDFLSGRLFELLDSFILIKSELLRAIVGQGFLEAKRGQATTTTGE